MNQLYYGDNLGILIGKQAGRSSKPNERSPGVVSKYRCHSTARRGDRRATIVGSRLHVFLHKPESPGCVLSLSRFYSVAARSGIEPLLPA
jgi:hypothetical protein